MLICGKLLLCLVDLTQIIELFLNLHLFEIVLAEELEFALAEDGAVAGVRLELLTLVRRLELSTDRCRLAS